MRIISLPDAKAGKEIFEKIVRICRTDKRPEPFGGRAHGVGEENGIGGREG